MVGICKVAKSGWLNHLEVCNDPAWLFDQLQLFHRFFSCMLKMIDTLIFSCLLSRRLRYCVEPQGHVHSLSEIWLFITISFLKMGISTLQPRYNGYTARSSDGPVRLYNPLSVIRPLTQNYVSNFWVETGTVIGLITWLNLIDLTGRYVPVSQKLWRASAVFRSKLDTLLMQKNVELIVDDHVNFLTCHCFHFDVARLSHDHLPDTILSLIPVFGVFCIILAISLCRPLRRNPWYVTE
jgi:hypothetical protein